MLLQSKVTKKFRFLSLFLMINTAFAEIAPKPEYESCLMLMNGDSCRFTPRSSNDPVNGNCQESLCMATTPTEPSAAGTQTHAETEIEANTGSVEPSVNSSNNGKVLNEGMDQGCDQSTSKSLSSMILRLGLMSLVFSQRKTLI